MKLTHKEIKTKLVSKIKEMSDGAKSGVEHIPLENIDSAAEAKDKAADCLAEGDILGVLIYTAIADCFDGE